MPIARPVTKTTIATTAWGIPITDEVNRLTPLVDAMKPTAWANIPLQNGWVNFAAGYPPASYRKIGDIVYVRGAIATGTMTLVAGIIPAGFRPNYSVQFAVASWSTTAVVQVDTSGNISPLSPGDNRFISLFFSYATA